MADFTLINATNSTASLLTTGSFVDFNVWLLIIGVSFVLLVVSRAFTKNLISALLFGIVSFLFGIASVWTSLSVARIDSAVSGIAYTDTGYIQYITPTIQPVSSLPLTILCVILVIFCALNLVDLFLTLIQEPPKKPEPNRLRINGIGVKFR
jgi:hypothetical protein